MRDSGDSATVGGLFAELPAITVPQMVEVDRLMIEEYRITLLQMMENVGRMLGRLGAALYLNGDPFGRMVTVLAGSGGNGGGALAAARRLAGWGASVRCCLSCQPTELSPATHHQLTSLEKIGVPVIDQRSLDSVAPELIIDGLIGYSLHGAPREPTASLIAWANHNPAPTLALDLPSGVDANTGAIPGSAVQAQATLTLALPKVGLMSELGKGRAGAVYLGDIGVPAQLYERLGLQVSCRIFSGRDVTRLW